MKIQPQKTERIHSLDSLRAIMMLLGLVIHSAITYSVFDFVEGWPLKDPSNTHLSNDFIVYFIHSFRMPIFFVVAGFFGSLLFYERKPLKMFNNRVSRIIFPFIIFLLLLSPLLIFASSYTQLIFDGSDTAYNTVASYFSNLLIFIPRGTFHLWFLYYLSIITFSSLILGLVFKKLPRLSKQISKSFSWIITKPIRRILVFSGLLSIICFCMGTFDITPPFSLVPDSETFTFFFFFYMIGWILYKSKHLLDHLMRFDWGCFVLGFVLITIHFVSMSSLTLEINILLNKYLQPMLKKDIDYLVLGCSHYPYLIPQLKKILPKQVKIIDSGIAVAKQTKNVLIQNNLFANTDLQTTLCFYTNTNTSTLEFLLNESLNKISINIKAF